MRDDPTEGGRGSEEEPLEELSASGTTDALTHAKLGLARERLAHEREKLALEREKWSSELAHQKRYYLSPLNAGLISLTSLLVGIGTGYLLQARQARTAVGPAPVVFIENGTNVQEALKSMLLLR